MELYPVVISVILFRPSLYIHFLVIILLSRYMSVFVDLLYFSFLSFAFSDITIEHKSNLLYGFINRQYGRLDLIGTFVPFPIKCF